MKQILHANGFVLQWQDTEKFNYTAPQSDISTLAVTDEQWANQDTLKWVRDGALTDIAPAPSLPSLDGLKAAKLAIINIDAQKAISPYTAGYPQFEIDTWPVQSAEAVAFALDSNASTPFCDLAAAQRGIDRVEFISRVNAKIELFTQLSATVAGYRQGLEDQIVAAVDSEDLDVIVWVSPI